MFEERVCDLFEVQADALVNTVNCVGVMGKGVALNFKRLYPDIFDLYQEACKQKQLRPGVVKILPGEGRRPHIILFPTKNHWRGRSRLVWIESGLAALRETCRERGLNSVAMPQLGCGLGGLKWEQVRPLIEKAFATEAVQIIVCAPSSSPGKPKGTTGWLWPEDPPGPPPANHSRSPTCATLAPRRVVRGSPGGIRRTSGRPAPNRPPCSQASPRQPDSAETGKQT